MGEKQQMFPILPRVSWHLKLGGWGRTSHYGPLVLSRPSSPSSSSCLVIVASLFYRVQTILLRVFLLFESFSPGGNANSYKIEIAISSFINQGYKDCTKMVEICRPSRLNDLADKKMGEI